MCVPVVTLSKCFTWNPPSTLKSESLTLKIIYCSVANLNYFQHSLPWLTIYMMIQIFSPPTHTQTPSLLRTQVPVLQVLCILFGFQRAVSCAGVISAILTLLQWPGWIQLCAVCLLRTAAEFVCGRLSERPARCDERHLDLPIHFTFAPINYSTGQPIKNEGERSGPRPPKAATRQLSPWIIGAINLALSNKGVLTLLSPSISLSLPIYCRPSQHTSHYRHTSQ